jgi:hypothetical protein
MIPLLTTGIILRTWMRMKMTQKPKLQRRPLPELLALIKALVGLAGFGRCFPNVFFLTQLG